MENPVEHKFLALNDGDDQILLEIIETRKDGNCMFETIMKCLQHKEIEHPTDMVQFRESIVDRVLNIDWTTNFVYTTLIDHPEIAVRAKALNCKSLRFVDDCRKLYEDYMKQPHTYGSTSELDAAAAEYGFNYCLVKRVKKKNGNIEYSIMNTEHPGRNLRFFLLFIGSFKKGHFRFLKPANPENPQFIRQGYYKKTESRTYWNVYSLA